MIPNEFIQFSLSFVIFTAAGLLLSVAVSTPDPLSQLLAWLAFLPVVLVGSYYLAYSVGFEWT